MKATIYKQLIALLFLFSLSLAVAAGDDYTKTLSKAFSTKGVTKLSVINKYGDVNIKNWDKDELSIKVTITVDARSESNAKDLFEDIKITLEKQNGEIIGHTDFDMRASKNNFSVDYEIFMPKTLDVELENKYGNVFINELSGHLDLTLKYGTLRINRLLRGDEKPHNSVDISYCENSHIRRANWLKLNMAYSKIDVERSTALMVLSKYSKLYTEVGNSVVAESKYDDYKLGVLDKFIIETKYSDCSIDKLQNRLEAEMKYTDMEVEKIPASFSVIDLDAQYGEVELGIEEGASYRLDADVQYADVEYPASDRVQIEQGHTDKRVKGYIGSANNPEARISVVTRYCDVELD